MINREIKMVEKAASFITDRIIAEKLISEDLRDWYIYSYLRIIETFISIGTVLTFSLFIGNTMPTVLFLLFFIALRSRTGGFHCNEFWQCYLVSNVVYIVISLTEPYIRDYNVTMCVLTAISSIVIFLVGTVNHPNISYDKEELIRSKTLARSILGIELIIMISMATIGIDRIYISYLAIGIILCAILMLLAKVFKQEVKKDEN